MEKGFRFKRKKNWISRKKHYCYEEVDINRSYENALTYATCWTQTLMQDSHLVVSLELNDKGTQNRSNTFSIHKNERSMKWTGNVTKKGLKHAQVSNLKIRWTLIWGLTWEFQNHIIHSSMDRVSL